jgi:hypothetical protein
MKMKMTTLKPKYAILFHLKDGFDDWGLQLIESHCGIVRNFDNIEPARKAMKDNFKRFMEDYEDCEHIFCETQKDYIHVEVPITVQDGNNKSVKSSIIGKWQIVKL